jgi:hypothetical protein
MAVLEKSPVAGKTANMGITDAWTHPDIGNWLL